MRKKNSQGVCLEEPYISNLVGCLLLLLTKKQEGNPFLKWAFWALDASKKVFPETSNMNAP